MVPMGEGRLIQNGLKIVQAAGLVTGHKLVTSDFQIPSLVTCLISG